MYIECPKKNEWIASISVDLFRLGGWKIDGIIIRMDWMN